MASPAPSTGSAPADPRRALADALDAVRQSDRERRASAGDPGPERRRAVSPLLVALFILIAGTGSWVIAARPAWLFDAPPPAETPAERDASLRMAMYTAARRVEQFRAARGTVPASLDSVALPVEGVTYVPEGASAWRIEGRAGELTLVLTSTDALEPFLGESYHILARRAHR
jgi:hypothetical protein